MFHASRIMLIMVCVSFLPCNAQKQNNPKPQKPHHTTNFDQDDFVAISSFAQLVTGLGQLLCKPNEQATVQGLQNVTNAALNFYQLMKKYGLTENESPEVIADVLVKNLAPQERKELTAQIQRAFVEVRVVLAKQITTA